jgi:hypothetical protein
MTNAAAVARALGRAGIPTWSGSWNREGLRVSGKGTVSVIASFDSRTTAESFAAAARDVLETAGYTVREVDSTILHVTK